MMGCALALLRSYPELADWLRTVLSPSRPILWAGLIIIGSIAWTTSEAAFLYRTLCYFATAAIINYMLDHPGGALGRLLQQPILVRLGVLSYSLYIWQQLITLRWNASAHPWITAPMAFGILFGIASFSYYAIEKPFISLRARLHY
jgi:peptidoglycan/LPS O-acetylase OafA/YrhL